MECSALPLEIMARIVRAIDDTDWAWSTLRCVSRDWRSAALIGVDPGRVKDWKVFYNREAIASHSHPATLAVVATAMRIRIRSGAGVEPRNPFRAIYRHHFDGDDVSNWLTMRLNHDQICHTPIAWVGPAAIRALMGGDTPPRTTFTAHQWITLILGAIECKRFAELAIILDYIPPWVRTSSQSSQVAHGWYSIMWRFSLDNTSALVPELFDRAHCLRLSAKALLYTAANSSLLGFDERGCSDGGCVLMNLVNAAAHHSLTRALIAMITRVPVRLWPCGFHERLEHIATTARRQELHSMIHELILLREK